MMYNQKYKNNLMKCACANKYYIHKKIQSSCNTKLNFCGYIDELSPGKGPITGGNIINIRGYNLNQAKSVFFNGVSINFTIIDSQNIKIIAPYRSNSSNPSVLVSFSDFVSNILYYEYIVAPTIINVIPDSGPLTGNNVITITGNNFEYIRSVNFGATSTTNFQVVNSNIINVVVPTTLTMGNTINITLINDASISNSIIYTLIPKPVI